MTTTQTRRYAATAAQVEEIRAALVKAGILPPSAASLEEQSFDAGHGFAVRAHYDAGAERLQVDLTGPAWLMANAWGRLEGRVLPYLGAS